MALSYPVQGFGQQITGSACDGVNITPSDTVDLTGPVRCIYVGVGGNIKVITIAGTSLTLLNAQSGAIIPLQIGRVMNTSTTATNLIGLI